MHYQLFFILDLLGDSPTAKSSVADLSWLGVADYTATAVSEKQRSGFELAWLTTSYFLFQTYWATAVHEIDRQVYEWAWRFNRLSDTRP